MSSIDMAQIQELKDIMEDAFGDLVSTYLLDSEDKLAQLEIAISAQNGSDIASLAHSIKGASANIFAGTLARLCQKVEDAGRANEVENLSEDFVAISTEFSHVKDQLQQLC